MKNTSRLVEKAGQDVDDGCGYAAVDAMRSRSLALDIKRVSVHHVRIEHVHGGEVEVVSTISR